MEPVEALVKEAAAAVGASLEQMEQADKALTLQRVVEAAAGVDSFFPVAILLIRLEEEEPQMQPMVEILQVGYHLKVEMEPMEL